MTERYQAYVVEYCGGYWSTNQGRVRRITDAQLYSLKELAQEAVDALDSDSCAIKPVWVEWEPTRTAIDIHQVWLKNAVKSLQDVPISGPQMPTYRNVPLTEFTRDDLIRIVARLRETIECHRQEAQSRLI